MDFQKGPYYNVRIKCLNFTIFMPEEAKVQMKDSRTNYPILPLTEDLYTAGVSVRS